MVSLSELQMTIFKMINLLISTITIIKMFFEVLSSVK